MVRISESNSNGCLRNVRTCLITNYSVPFNFYFITSFVWIVTKSPFFYTAKCWACLCLLTCSHSLSPCHVSLPGADVKVWAILYSVYNVLVFLVTLAIQARAMARLVRAAQSLVRAANSKAARLVSLSARIVSLSARPLKCLTCTVNVPLLETLAMVS